MRVRQQEPFTVAAVQAAPVFLDRAATLEKACGLIAEAGRRGARLILFPEAFVSGYPDWVWVLPGGERSELDALYTEMLESAVAVPDDATKRLGRAAKAAGAYVAIGVSERNRAASDASLYNSLLLIDDQGAVVGTHRKLIPTGAERTVWAPGDGSTMAAYPTPLGTVAGLICWENYMPLARQALYAWGTQVYLAPTWDRGEVWQATLRHIAKEGGTYVVGATMVLRPDDIPDRFAFKSRYPAGTEWINDGGSAIIAPDGTVLAGPVVGREEIVTAEIDLQATAAAKRMLDVGGHYARPDVFTFELNLDPRPVMGLRSEEGALREQ